MERTDIGGLPEDIIQGILLKALYGRNSKSLTVLKCVCKRWRSLICNPDFVTMHFKHQPPCMLYLRHHPYAVDRILTTTCTFSEINHEIDDLDDKDDHDSWSTNDYFTLPAAAAPSSRSDSWINVIGSCNGIVCLCIHEGEVEVPRFFFSIHLWNPATGESKKLPDCHSFVVPIDHRPQLQLQLQQQYYAHSDHRSRVGFGYDPLTDDYKVFRICQMANAVDNHVHVYSLAKDSWDNKHLPRGIIPDLVEDDEDDNIFGFGFGLGVNNLGNWVSGVVNGYLHWTIKDRPIELPNLFNPHHNYDWCIVAVNVNTEVFDDQIIKPPPFSDPSELRVNLGEAMVPFKLDRFKLHGEDDIYCLAFLVNKRLCCWTISTDVWVMKQYGVSSSWTKHFTIIHQPLEFIWPPDLGITANGQIVMAKSDPSQCLVFFDPNNSNSIPREFEFITGSPDQPIYRHFVNHLLTMLPIKANRLQNLHCSNTEPPTSSLSN